MDRIPLHWDLIIYIMIHFHMVHLMVGRQDSWYYISFQFDIHFITDGWMDFSPVLFYIIVDLQFGIGFIHIHCSFYISCLMYS